MREYYTRERDVELLSNCERAGINTHQFHDPGLRTDIIRTLRERGSKMKFICLHAGDGIEQVVRDTGPSRWSITAGSPTGCSARARASRSMIS